jgi:3-methylcrotonyl-CoA carboxylase alpha subunit
MTDARRRAMGDAAIAAARAVGYVGAGTVEFIADADGSFYFMEMNTRLQVEHPVTEMVTGLDLVEWQLRVAAGEPLPMAQADLAIRGHAIEARIYAENPEKGFLPSTGTLAHLRTPAAVEFTTGAPAAVRIDSGIAEGDAISPHYDPMIAKLITWGRDRSEAIVRMRQALARYEAVGPSTNVAFLGRLMRCGAFVDADLDTGLIERERAALLPETDATPADPALLATAAAAVLALEDAQDQQAPSRNGAHGWRDPWSTRSGWRPAGNLHRTLGFTVAGGSHAVDVAYGTGGRVLRIGDLTTCIGTLRLDGRRLTGALGDRMLDLSVVLHGETLHLFDATGHHAIGYAPALAHAGDDAAEAGGLTAPMPGKVIAVLVEAGATVSKGQPLLVMEAMKMEHTIAAPSEGKVASLPFRVGDQVAEGATLVVLG